MGEILFTEEVDGAIIRIYKNGFLTYAVNNGDEEPRTTVYSVHKCSKIVFFTGFSEDEYKEECGWCGEHSKVSYRVVENPVTGNRQLTRIVTVDEKAYQNCVWWLPIVTICDERLGHNDYARFMNKIDLKDNDDFDMDEHDPNDWLEAITLSEEDEENHEILVEAMKTLTKVQYKTVALYYHEGLSERDIAKVLKVKHQSVHDNLEAAMQRLRKFFFENLTSE